MKCLIVREEISQEECECVQAECYKAKNGKELPKRFKRILGWNMICKTCQYHTVGLKKKK